MARVYAIFRSSRKTRCQITPRYNDLPRALPLACAVRWSLRKAKGKNGKSSPTRSTSSELPMIPTRYRRRGIHPSFCARSRISVHARTFLAASFVFVADLHSPFTNRSEEHTSELQSQSNLVCRLLLE